MKATWGVAIAALVLTSSLASAGVTLQHGTASTKVGVLAPLVTLAAGATGVTTLGTNLTSASTTKIASNRAEEVLRVELKAPKAQIVSVRLVSTTNLANINKAVIMVGNATQINIANGVVTQTTGSTVALGTGGLSVSGNFKLNLLSVTPTMTMDIETRPSPTGPLAKERWVVTLK